MSRRSRQAAFSLFSFQDIVTSVTAIMILLVLILSLELIDRRQAAAATSSTATRTALQETITELERFVEQLAARTSGGVELAPLKAKTRSEIERDTRIVESQAERAVAEAAAAKAVERRAAAAAGEMLQQVRERRAANGSIEVMREEAAAADAEAQRLAVDNEKERERLAKKQQELDERPAQGTELVFNAPPESQKQPWLLEVAAEGVAVLRLGSNERQSLGRIKAADGNVHAWVARLNSSVDYILILVRPSGVESYEAVRELLENRRIDFGVDLIGEDQAVRDGSGEQAEAGGD